MNSKTPRKRSAAPPQRAILLVDHGSRSAAANRVVAALARKLRRRLPGAIVHFAHMEVAPPTIAEAVDACVAAGAREIVVQPYFLAPGIHSTRDVPALARAAARRHRGVRVRVTAPLGSHDLLVDIVLDRVGNA
jgi:sirohydrochlorin ferrochelatase